MDATPLLLNKFAGKLHLLADNGDYLPAKGFRQWKSVFWLETLNLWMIGFPITITMICQFGISSVTDIFVGHLGVIELSAITIATSVVGTFSFGFLLGMGSALETLCGQAFGAGQVHLLGVYMQRSWIILFVSCIVIIPIYIFATPILKLLGQDDDIANLAGVFCIQTIPQLFSLAFNFPIQKFLQAQSKVNAVAWIGFLALVAHTILIWLFVCIYGWGTTGAAWALNLSSWGNVVGQFVYIVYWCKDGWNGFSSEAFTDIWVFVKLSISSAVMLCLEIWYMMSIIILTGHLNNAATAVGSLSICMNVNGWEAMVFFGINAAMSVRVSNEIGMGHPRAIKYSVYVIIFQSFMIGLLCMVIVVMTKDDFSIIFTNNAALIKEVSSLAYLLGVTMILNSIQPVISGVAVGGGWQGLVAYINLGCYYAFGIPLGIFLGYTFNLGVQGLWGGMICGTALQTLLLLLVLYRTDWTKEVEQSIERLQIWGGQKVEKGTDI
ncbi:protein DETOXIFICATION 35 [Cynara cardunculus var. scolymus]|uniref:protein DETOXIFICATION 35 n=1 Tax=Cynara cardunculus var. scolymus TaxID=59895 RepID=UPI000D623EF5|nr:protein DETOXIFICATION 35 [Cynara cardunculus var. scolymus]